MLTIDIKKAGSKDVLATVDIPSTLYELPLNRYIDFVVAQRGFDAENANPFAVMGRAVAYLLGVNVDELIDAETFGEATADAKEQTIESLYAYGCKLVGQHKPALRVGDKIKVGEDWFLIPSINIQHLVGEGGNLSLLEMVEAYEIRRVVRDRIAKEGDEEGSLWYSEYLNLLAVLFRKEGERLPIDDRARAVFLDDRAATLQEIDAGTALDVDFFLTHCLLAMNQTAYLVGSLTLSALKVSQEVRTKASGGSGRRKRQKMRLAA